MNIDRFTQILEAYGTREANWPEDERHDAMRLLQSSDSCSALLQSHQSLDDLLDDYQPRASLLSSRHILRCLPQPLIDRFISWLIPGQGENLWRPLLAGTLPLVVGVIIGTSSLGDLPGSEINESATIWEDEIYLLVLDDSAYPPGSDNE